MQPLIRLVTFALCLLLAPFVHAQSPEATRALLANVARTATITATRSGSLLAIQRVPFLVAVTGTDSSRQAAWGVIRSMNLEEEGDDVPTHKTLATASTPLDSFELPVI